MRWYWHVGALTLIVGSTLVAVVTGVPWVAYLGVGAGWVVGARGRARRVARSSGVT